MLIEDPPIAKREKVKLEALELQTSRRWNVADHDRAKVGLTSLWADRRELRTRDLDSRNCRFGNWLGNDSTAAGIFSPRARDSSWKPLHRKHGETHSFPVIFRHF